MKITRFQDIQKFTAYPSYSVHVEWDFLLSTLGRWKKDYDLDMSPDFQRNHVWTEAQQIAFVEFVLRGGNSGKDIYFNYPGWNSGDTTQKMVLVDGKQRLEAARRFLNNEIPIFGSLYEEYTDRLRLCLACFHFNVSDLKIRRNVLQWYLDMNSGYDQKELDKVKELIAASEAY